MAIFDEFLKQVETMVQGTELNVANLPIVIYSDTHDCDLEFTGIEINDDKGTPVVMITAEAPEEV